MKLEIELVPQPLWYKNLRSLLPKSQWDKIRKSVYARSNYACEICGIPKDKTLDGLLYCHEQWRYDDKKHVQKLVGFECTCVKCLYVNHRGMANVLGIPDDIIAEHFIQTNRCDHETYETSLRKAFAVWEERGRHRWKQDLTHLPTLVERLPPVPKNPAHKMLDTFIKQAIEERKRINQ